MKNNPSLKALMLLVGLALPGSGYSQDNGDNQQLGVSREAVTWQFVASGRVIATNVLEQMAAIKHEAYSGMGVEFRINDEMANTLVRGRIRRFAAHARLYSGFYTEITNSSMPKELLLSRMELDVSGDIGDICVREKRWDAAQSQFVTTKQPKFVYFTEGMFLVNVCGDGREVLHRARQIAKSLAQNQTTIAESTSIDFADVIAARHIIECNDTINPDGNKVRQFKIFGPKGEITAVGAWLSLALLDDHWVCGANGMRRRDVALRLLNESHHFVPKLAVTTIDDVVSALRRTIGREQNGAALKGRMISDGNGCSMAAPLSGRAADKEAVDGEKKDGMKENAETRTVK